MEKTNWFLIGFNITVGIGCGFYFHVGLIALVMKFL